MTKSTTRISVVLALVLFVSMFASFSALAAGEKRFDMKHGGYVTISNVVEGKNIKSNYDGWDVTKYVVTAPVTITFHGDLLDETRIAKWADEESLEYVDIKNNTAVLTDTVEYGIFPVFKGDSKQDNAPILLQVVAGNSEAKEPSTTAESKSEQSLAAPTAAKVLVNDKDVSFEAYNINGNNYLKLRDLAMSVNGTEKNFEVSWDAAKNAIALTSKKAYTPDGKELTTSGTPTSKAFTETTSNVYLDGKEVKFTAYNIDGNNYFKLRDVAKMMNIGVKWDAAANSIRIDTKAAYEE